LILGGCLGWKKGAYSGVKEVT